MQFGHFKVHLPVYQTATNAPLEETTAAVASQDAVMLTRTGVSAHQTGEARYGVLATDRVIGRPRDHADRADRRHVARAVLLMTDTGGDRSCVTAQHFARHGHRLWDNADGQLMERGFGNVDRPVASGKTAKLSVVLLMLLLLLLFPSHESPLLLGVRRGAGR